MAEPHDDAPDQDKPDDQLDKPDMKNGVPDKGAGGEATALPNSDREETENAAGRNG